MLCESGIALLASHAVRSPDSYQTISVFSQQPLMVALSTLYQPLPGKLYDLICNVRLGTT
jgi:hypothetical protein